MRLHLFLLFLLLLILRSNAPAGEPVVGSWETFGNGPAHTGYYPATIGSGTFAPGWSKTFTVPINQVVVSGTGVFYTTNAYHKDGMHAGALDEQTGQLLWTYPLAAALAINPPTFAGGKVYFQRSYSSTDTNLWCLNAETGELLWKSSYDSQGNAHMAPAVAGDAVWIGGGAFGGMYWFDAETGKQKDFFPQQQFDNWTPAIADGAVYSWVNGDLKVFNSVNGAPLWSRVYGDGGEHLSYSVGSTVAVLDGRVAMIGVSGLRAVDLNTRQQAWLVPGTFVGTPAMDHTSVYALSGYTVKCYDAASGMLTGNYNAASALISQALVTNDLVIAASETNTYIFDRASRVMKQALPVGGYLSYAKGRLYVTTKYDASKPGKITTYVVNPAQPEPAPSPAPSPTPTATPSPTATPTPLPTPSPSPLPTPPAGVPGPAWIDAKMGGEIAYFLFASPARVERYNLAGGQWLSSVPLGGTATAIAIDGDGLYVSFGTSTSRFALDGSNSRHLTDTPAPVKALFADGDILYLVSGDLVWSVNKNTGQSLYFTSYFNSMTGLSYARELNTMFARDTGSSPADIVRVKMDEEGKLGEQSDSPYSSAFPNASKTFLSPDEDKVYDDSGIVYNTSDLSYAGSLAGSYTDIGFNESDPVVIRAKMLVTYGDNYRETGRRTLPGTPGKLFVLNEAGFVFYNASSRGVWALKVPLSTVVPPSPTSIVNPAGLAYVPDAAEYGDGIVYLLSKSKLSIFRWSVGEKKYLGTIRLYEAPTHMSYSRDPKRLYLGYASGRMSYFAEAEPGAEQNFANLPQASQGLAAAGDVLFASDNSGPRASHYGFTKDGEQASKKDWSYASPEYVWNPVLRKMYFFRTDSPHDILWEDLDTEGKLGVDFSRPYFHQGEGIEPPLRISPDGGTVVLGSGYVFDAVSLAHTGTLTSPHMDAAWTGGKLVTMSENGSASQLLGWNETYTGTTKMRAVTGAPIRVFGLDSKLLAITSVSGAPKFTLFDSTLDEIVEPIVQTRVIALSGTLNFGNVQVNQTATRVLSIANQGNSPLAVTGISHDLSAFSGDFSGTIAAGGSRNVTITFAPTAAGDYPGQLGVVSNATSGTFTKAETGKGVAAPTPTPSPTPSPSPTPAPTPMTRILSLDGDIDFGKVAPNTMVTRTLTMLNTGNSDLIVTGLTHPNAVFQGAYSGTIAPGDAQDVTITFVAPTYKSYSGKLKVLSNATAGITSLTEKGAANRKPVNETPTRIVAVSGDLDFGSVVLKKSATRTLTIINQGSHPLTIHGLTHPQGVFTGNLRGAIPAGKSRKVTVTFRPVRIGTSAGKIGISSNATGGIYTVAETGVGAVAVTRAGTGAGVARSSSGALVLSGQDLPQSGEITFVDPGMFITGDPLTKVRFEPAN